MSKLSKLCKRHLGLAATIVVATLLTSCGGQEAPLTEQRQQAAMRAMSGPPASAPSDTAAIFSGPRNNYVITRTETGLEVTDVVGSEGTVSLSGKTCAKFSDVTVNLLVGDKSKTISAESLKSLIELYVAFFNRVPDADGLSYWIDQVKAGMTMDQLANHFYAAAIIYSDLTGYSKDMTDAEFVRIIYKNALGRTGASAPPDADVQYWADHLRHGTRTKGSLVATMLYSAHTFAGDPTWGWMPQLLDNKVSVGNYFAVEQGLNYQTPQESIAKTMDIVSKITPASIEAAKSLINLRDTRLDLSVNAPSAPGVYAFVGSFSGSGNLDGVGSDARFEEPAQILADVDDTLYVYDRENFKIRRLTKDGVVSTFANSVDPSWFRFNNLSGRLKFTNSIKQVQLFYPDGRTALFENYVIPNEDYLHYPYRDIDDNFYQESQTFEQGFSRIFKNGKVLAGDVQASMAKDGIGSDARFVLIGDVQVFPNKMMYVLDKDLSSGKYQLRQISPDGVVSTLGTPKFEMPARIIPNSGTLPTILDINGIHKLQASGNWGFTPISDGKRFPRRQMYPVFSTDATADKEGNIYLVDPGKNLVLRITAQGQVSDFAGKRNPETLGTALDGRGNAAGLRPIAMSKDRIGNLYVIESRISIPFQVTHKSLTLRKISPEGEVTTLAAPGIWWGQADSTGIAETFGSPSSLAVDSQQNIWIYDSPYWQTWSWGYPSRKTGNAIRKISPEGKLTTVEENSLNCLDDPYLFCSLVFDSKNNLLVRDRLGVRKLNADGTLTAIAGLGLDYLWNSVFPDSIGNLYFLKKSGKEVGKLSVSGAVTSYVVPENIFMLSGDQTILADEQGNVFSYANCALHKTTPSGAQTIIVGVPGECGVRPGNLQKARLGGITSLAWLGKNSLLAISVESHNKIDDKRGGILKIVVP